MPREIALTRGLKMIIDDEDYDFLSQWQWYSSLKYRKGNDQVIARRSSRFNGKVVAVYAHRVIAERMGLDIDQKICHLDGNTLNNRRSNIGYKNGFPRSKKFENTGVVITARSSVTGRAGITFKAVTGKYVAQVTNPKERVTHKIGEFDDIESAVKAREEFLETWDGLSGSSRTRRLYSV